MRVFCRRNAKQMCRSRSNSLVAVIHIDNIVQPAVVKRLCIPCLLFVLFIGNEYQRWSEWLLNACPCFDKKDPISCFEAHWKFTRILLFRLGKPEKILPAWKIFARAFFFCSLILIICRLLLLKLAVTKLTRYFWTLWPNWLKLIFLVISNKNLVWM